MDAGFLYRCVDCGRDLADLTRCPGCGRTYGQADGRPSAFPEGEITYTVRRPPTATDPSQIPAAEVFHYPPSHGQAASEVYHLDAAHKAILEALPQGARLLETGCGGAQLRSWAKQQGLAYLGTDVSTERVFDSLQTHGGADLFCDAHALPFADQSVDVIYASAVYEHLAYPHIAMAEAYRVLRPGGYMLGSMSFLEPWHDESYNHMTPNGVYVLLATTGLKPQAIWPELAWPGFVAMLAMGSQTTMILKPLGRVMNWIYLLPARVKNLLGLQGSADLYEPRARTAGAITWIAVKPQDEATGDAP